MLAIILLHVNTKVANFNSGVFWEYISAVIHSFCSLGVSSFVMLSGAFTLGNEKNEKYLYYWKKTFIKIIEPTLLVSVVYMAWNFIFLYRSVGFACAWKDVLLSLIQGKPYYHLWYMYMIIILYLIVPFIIKIKNLIGSKAYTAIGICGVLLGVIIGAFYKSDFEWGINSFKYIGYFILGDCIHSAFIINKSHRKAMCVLPVALAAFGGDGLLRIYEIKNNVKIFPMSLYSSVCPFIIVGTILIFIAFANMKVKNNPLISSLAENSFWMYLVHALVLEIIIILLEKSGIAVIRSTGKTIVFEIFLWLIIAVCSYFAAVICSKIYQWILGIIERTVNSIDRG